jgi:tRNA dimethylallyltransferase
MQNISESIISSYELWQIPIIYGQTATGKTRLSLELVKKMRKKYHKDVEIISADSRQVYRYMDIGTDKIGLDIRSQIIHHQIDIINPDQTYTAGQWQQDAYMIIDEIIWRGNIPMIVWWTGLYIDTIVYNFNMGICEPDWEFRRSLEELVLKQEISTIASHADSQDQSGSVLLWNMLNEVDPIEAAKHHPSSERFIIRALEISHKTGIPKSQLVTKQAPKYPLLLIDLQQDVQKGNELIDIRLEQMIEQWLITEVQWLLDKWYSRDFASMRTIDYKQTIQYIDGELSYEEYMRALQVINHQLAKKQRTWFRRYNSLEESEHTKRLSFYLPDYR